MPRRPTAALAVIRTPCGRVLVRPLFSQRQRSWSLVLDGPPPALELLVPRNRLCAARSHRRSLTPPGGATSLSALRAYLAERHAEWSALLAHGHARQPPRERLALYTVADLIAHAERDIATTIRTSSAAVYAKHHRRLLRSLPGPTPLPDLTAERCQAVVADLIAAGLRPATVVNIAKSLVRLCRLGVDAGVWADSPMRTVALPAIPDAERTPLSDADRQRLLAVATTRGRDAHLLVALGLYAGLRRSELLALRWIDVDLGQRVLHVRNHAAFVSKSGRGRAVPMARELHAILAGIAPRVGTAYVIAPHRLHRPKRPRWAFDKTIAAIARAAAVPHFHPHAMRHDFATRCIESGVPLSKVKLWMGHASITTTHRYLHHAVGFDADIDRRRRRA